MSDIIKILAAETLMARNLLSELYCALSDISSAQHVPTETSFDDLANALLNARQILKRITYYQGDFLKYSEQFISNHKYNHNLYKSSSNKNRLIASLFSEINQLRDLNMGRFDLSQIYDCCVFLHDKHEPLQVGSGKSKILALDEMLDEDNYCLEIEQIIDLTLPIRFVQHSFSIPAINLVSMASFKEFIFKVTLAAADKNYVGIILVANDQVIFQQEMTLTNNRTYLTKNLTREDIFDKMTDGKSNCCIRIETWSNEYHKVPIYIYDVSIFGI